MNNELSDVHWETIIIASATPQEVHRLRALQQEQAFSPEQAARRARVGALLGEYLRGMWARHVAEKAIRKAKK